MNRIIPKFTHEQIEYIRYLIDTNPCCAVHGSGNFASTSLPEAINQMERDLITSTDLNVIRSRSEGGNILLKISRPKDLEKVEKYEKLEYENFQNELLYSVYVDNKLYDYSIVKKLRKINETDLTAEIISIKNKIFILNKNKSFFGKQNRNDEIEDLKKKLTTHNFMKEFNEKANETKKELENLKEKIKKMEIKT